MQELSFEEIELVDGGVSIVGVVGAGALVGFYAMATIGAFGVGFAIGTVINRGIRYVFP